MASLEGVLAQIPGYGGYLAQRQQNEQAGAQELQQFGAVQGVLANLAAQQQKRAELQRQEQYRAELAANPDKAQEIALKYATPDKVLDVQTRRMEGVENRNARMQERVLALDAAAANAALSREERAARAEEAAALRRELQAGQQAFAALQSRNAAADRENLARLAAGMRQPQQPIVKTDEQGNTKLYDYQGNLIRDLGKTSAPSVQVQKVEAAKKQTVMDLDRAITELGKATQDGGLIDKSTGSGAGALVDMGAGFFGAATPGAIAVGQLKPIYDLVLKMVPRFEGPQSDKDTKSYSDAAGQIANPNVPNQQKKIAGREILRLMIQRKGQFTTKDPAGSESPPAQNGVKFLGFE